MLNEYNHRSDRCQSGERESTPPDIFRLNPLGLPGGRSIPAKPANESAAASERLKRRDNAVRPGRRRNNVRLRLGKYTVGCFELPIDRESEAWFVAAEGTGSDGRGEEVSQFGVFGANDIDCACYALVNRESRPLRRRPEAPCTPFEAQCSF
jgi:hypothetical protein